LFVVEKNSEGKSPGSGAFKGSGGSMKMWVTRNAGGSELPETFVAINSVGLDIVT
jgi:hypothetical protein